MPAKNRGQDISWHNLNGIIFIKFWLPVLACMGLIFYASSLSGSDIPSVFPFQDIMFHFLVYLTLGFLFSRALSKTHTNLTLIKVFLFTVIFGTFYAITDEFHQAFVPLRDASAFDVFIDTAGNLAGSLSLVFLHTRLFPKENKESF